MKKFLLCISLATLTALSAFSVYRYDRALTLIWDNNPPADQVTQYRLYIGISPTNYTVSYLSSTNTLTLQTNQFFPGKTNYFAVSAINSVGLESELSDEISEFIITPPSKPINLRR